MNPPLILLHDEALRATHPVFAAAPEGCRAVFAWDDAYFQKAGYSLKRLVFMYETLCELPVDLLHASAWDVVQHLAPGRLYIPAASNPLLLGMIDTLRPLAPVTIVAEEPFVTIRKPIDARRFFQYWKKAEKTAFLSHGGAHD
ncbi:MAG: hypothetical protein DI582_04395 [Azospirillum brasilense]|nr:MAG: hypothetical protein DI582_04395 [Azospirillum brasilense]